MTEAKKMACENATQSIIRGGRLILKQCELTQESCHSESDLIAALSQLIVDCRVLGLQAQNLKDAL